MANPTGSCTNFDRTEEVDWRLNRLPIARPVHTTDADVPLRASPRVPKTGCYLFALPNPGGNPGQIPTTVSRSQYHISVYFFSFL